MSELKPIYHVTQKRVNLGEAAPLAVPLSMYIETSAICNLRCKFCFQCNQKDIADSGIKLGLMSLETFKLAIEGLQKFDRPLKLLHLFSRGEPLLNPNIVEMVKIAKQAGVAECISITTNGTLLTKELSKKLVEAGLDNLKVSVESMSTEGYERVAGKRIDFDAFIENIKYFYSIRGNCHLYVKCLHEALDAQERELFVDTFRACVDEYNFEHIVDVWPKTDLEYLNTHRDSQIRDSYGYKQQNSLVCPVIFYTFFLLWDGTFIPCGGDYRANYVIGNINRMSVPEAWGARKFDELRIEVLKGNKNKLELCKDCQFLNGCCVDNIDDMADVMLAKFMQHAG